MNGCFRKVSLLLAASVVMLLGGNRDANAGWPPMPADSDLANAYAAAKNEYAAASRAGYFSEISQFETWPCEVDDKLLRGLAGALNPEELEPRLLSLMKRQALDQGRGAGEAVLHVRDIKVFPLVANCLNGRLSGSVKYRINYVSELLAPTMRLTSRMSSVVYAQMLDGGLLADAFYRTAVKTHEQTTQWLDPSSNAVIKNGGIDRSASTTVVVAWPTDAQGLVMIWGSQVTLKSPERHGLQEARGFDNGKLISVVHLKDGRLHGPMQIFEHKVNGLRIPATKLCYSEGELLKTSDCTLD